MEKQVYKHPICCRHEHEQDAQEQFTASTSGALVFHGSPHLLDQLPGGLLLLHVEMLPAIVEPVGELGPNWRTRWLPRQRRLRGTDGCEICKVAPFIMSCRCCRRMVVWSPYPRYPLPILIIC
jgi:hypothetical protein